MASLRRKKLSEHVTPAHEAVKGLQRALTVLQQIKEKLNRKNARFEKEKLLGIAEFINDIINWNAGCLTGYKKVEIITPETAELQQTMIARCDKLQGHLSWEFLVKSAALLTVKSTKTIRTILAEYGVTIDQMLGDHSPRAISSDVFIQKKMAEDKLIETQLDVAHKLELPRSKNLSILQSIKMQICSALYIKQILATACHQLAITFLNAKNHEKAKQNIESYGPFIHLYGLLSFIPLEKLSFCLFLDAPRTHFNKFLQETANVDIAHTITEYFPHADKAQLEVDILEFREARQLLIECLEKYYQIEATLTSLCKARQISSEQLRGNKQMVLNLFYDGCEQRFNYQHRGIKYEAAIVAKFLDNKIDIFDPRSLNHLLYLVLTLSELKEILGITIAGEEPLPEEKKKAEPKPDEAAKKKKKKAKKKKTAGQCPPSEPTSLASDNATQDDKAGKADDKAEVASADEKHSARTAGQFKVNPAAELDDLKKSAEFNIMESKEAEVPSEIWSVARSMQINAMLFDMIKLLKKRRDTHLSKDERNRARLLRNAMVHCKGFIEETHLTPGQHHERLNLLYAEVKTFAQALIGHVEDPSNSELASCAFYTTCLNHGLQLDRGKQMVSFAEKIKYTQLLNLQWTHFDFPWLSLKDHLSKISNEHIYQSALMMLMRKFQEYTSMRFKPEIMSELLSAFHGKDDYNVVKVSMAVNWRMTLSP